MKFGIKSYSYKHTTRKTYYTTINGEQFSGPHFAEQEARGAIEEIENKPSPELIDILIKAIRARFQESTPGEYYGAMHLLSLLEPALLGCDAGAIKEILDTMEEKPKKGCSFMGKSLPKMAGA